MRYFDGEINYIRLDTSDEPDHSEVYVYADGGWQHIPLPYNRPPSEEKQEPENYKRNHNIHQLFTKLRLKDDLFEI